jgi:hypothetical protein
MTDLNDCILKVLLIDTKVAPAEQQQYAIAIMPAAVRQAMQFTSCEDKGQ